MADVLLGKDVVLSAFITGSIPGYYPIACLQEVTLNVATQLIPTTTPDSGAFRTFASGLSEWKLSVGGVWFLASVGKYVALDLIRDQVRSEGLDIKLLMTDTGNYTRQIEGHVYIPESSFTGTAGSIAKFTAEFQGSGTLTLDGAITINPTNVQRLEYEASGGETVIQDNDWILRSIKWLDRSDSSLKIILTGTPTGRQVLYNGSAGSFTFPAGSALNAGELITGLYE